MNDANCVSFIYSDWKLFTGALQEKFPIAKFPYTPGFDVAGKVVKPVDGFSMGDRVVSSLGPYSCRDPPPMPQGPAGALAKFVCLPAKQCVKIKNKTKFKEVAGLPIAGVTAFQALFGGEPLGDATEGNRILILGGASGVGSLAIQLAKKAGCTVAATASPRPINENTDVTKCELLEELGCDVVIDYTKEDWVEVMDGANYDIIFDCVGNMEDLTEKAPRALKKGGQFISIANFGGRSTDHVKYSSFHAKLDKKDLQKLVDMTERHDLVVPIDSEYHFNEAKDAFKRSCSGHATGKILVKCA